MLTHPQFNPVALQLGPVAIHWYGITYLIAFRLFLWLAGRRVRLPQHLAVGWTRQDVDDVLFYGVLGVVQWRAMTRAIPIVMLAMIAYSLVANMGMRLLATMPTPDLPLWITLTTWPAAAISAVIYVASLQGAMMLAIAWRLACETLDARRALVAVLLISGMTYYTNRLHFFNHNTALMVCHAGAAYCVWRCVSSGRLLWWSLLGLCWGAIASAQSVGSAGCAANPEAPGSITNAVAAPADSTSATRSRYATR